MQRSLARSQPKLQNKWQREAKQKAKRKRAGAADRGDGDGDGDGDEDGSLERVVSYPRQQAQSHTGYLTAARQAGAVRDRGGGRGGARGGAARRGQNGGGEENDDEFSE